MSPSSDPLLGIDAVPWSRIVHFFGRATAIPDNIRDLGTDNHVNAEQELLGCLEHQDGIIQATPFGVWFIVKMLTAGRVRDPDAVRSLLAVIQAGAESHLQSKQPSAVTMDWHSILAEERLWPEFTSERDDEIQWEEWNPSAEEWYRWGELTDRFIKNAGSNGNG